MQSQKKENKHKCKKYLVKTTLDRCKIEEKENLQDQCFTYLADLAKTIYEDEEKREISLIQQAGNMQTAFSFVIAALFMLLAIIMENTVVLPMKYIFIMFSSISVALLFSLFAATMAQNRMKRNVFPGITDIKNLIITEYNYFKTEAQRKKYLAETYEKMYDSYVEKNEKRRVWVKISMISFYVALALCSIWFFITVYILI